MKTIGRGYWVAGWLWAALWVQSAQAIELCVNSVGTLEQALALFPLHGPGQLTIKVVQGTYAVGSQLGGIYLAANATSLALLGGYTVVPEPSSIALLLMGGVAVLRRRK